MSRFPHFTWIDVKHMHPLPQMPTLSKYTDYMNVDLNIISHMQIYSNNSSVVHSRNDCLTNSVIKVNELEVWNSRNFRSQLIAIRQFMISL